jgi:hypothetical protein
MLCSNCAKPLGAIAHIFKDQLLCENCSLKTQSSSQFSQAPTTIVVSKHDDRVRADASQVIPSESNPQPQESITAQTTQIVAPPQHQSGYFYLGEQGFLEKNLLKKTQSIEKLLLLK